MHPKSLQHLGRCSKPNGLTLLLNRQSRQEDRDEAVLAKGHAEIGVTSNLEEEMSVPPLIHKSMRRKPAHWQPAEHERSRTECERLSALLALHADDLNCFCLAELLSGHANPASPP